MSDSLTEKKCLPCEGGVPRSPAPIASDCSDSSPRNGDFPLTVVNCSESGRSKISIGP